MELVTNCFIPVMVTDDPLPKMIARLHNKLDLIEKVKQVSSFFRLWKITKIRLVLDYPFPEVPASIKIQVLLST